MPQGPNERETRARRIVIQVGTSPFPGASQRGVHLLGEAVTQTGRRNLHHVTESRAPVCCGAVFGSQTGIRSGPGGDIDPLVASPAFDESQKRRPLYPLWWRSTRVDSRIELVSCGEWQWETGDESALIQESR